MTVTSSVNPRQAYPADAPRDSSGKPVPPAPYFHEWDPSPHGIFPNVEVGNVRLGDVILGGTHQVEGIGRAEQRGAPALRFDLQYLVGPTMEATARLILPTDHQLEVKRYITGPDGRSLADHRYAWIRLDSEDHPAEPTLIPDYGHRVTHCCALKKCGSAADDLNPDGYELSQVMCDLCVESWDVDYEVVRG